MKRMKSPTASGKLGISSVMIVVLLLGPSGQAQSGDWQAVKSLKAGTLISVKARRHYVCFLEDATKDELVCNVPRRRFDLPSGRVTIPRGEIREVRLELNQAKHAWIGAGIGAGVGTAVGARTGSGSRGAGALIGGLGGAAAGGVVGSIVPIFRRGKLIYKP